MKVDRVELFLLSLPYVHYFETSLGREESRTFIIVKVCAEGICGYGEVVAEKDPHYSYETTSTAWQILKDYLVPLVLGEVHADPVEFCRRANRYRGHPMAKAGMELALWDIAGKSQGKPLWKVYGGIKEEIPSGVSVGIQETVEELVERVVTFWRLGYQRIKIKIKPGWDVVPCRTIRNRWPEIPLQVDANGAYSLEDREILRKLDAFGLLMLEQPFPPYDLWDHSRLQAELKTPVCLDESAISAETVRQAHEMGSCRIINIKVGRVGGIIEARRIHDYCQSHGIPVWCGGMLESGIGRAHNIHMSSLPNFKLPNDLSASSRYYSQDLIEPPIVITPQGTIRVPDGPGIGVVPDQERIKNATLRREVFS
jgi:O-succinylbenzoate synthase